MLPIIVNYKCQTDESDDGRSTFVKIAIDTSSDISKQSVYTVCLVNRFSVPFCYISCVISVSFNKVYLTIHGFEVSGIAHKFRQPQCTPSMRYSCVHNALITHNRI